ncbi:hypothetical protein Hanom_Chr03g00201501 [Helianthus anomalus]
MFPVDLKKLIGKMFVFKIEITTYNLTNFDEMYFVTNLTDDESIINELKEKMKIAENLSKRKVTFQVLRMMTVTPVVIPIKLTKVDWMTSTSLQLQLVSRLWRKLARNKINSYFY